MELIFYRDRMHRNEVEAKLRNDEKMERLFKQSAALITQGTSLSWESSVASVFRFQISEPGLC